MRALIENATYYYNYLNDELADPRTKNLFMISGPLPLIIVLVLYRHFVLHWGPSFMKNRQPYNLKYILIAYNIFQIYKCAQLAWEAFYLIYWSGYYSIRCQKLIDGTTPLDLLIVNRIWQYYMIKLLDLFDTVFFVFRKKFNQISFLHVYHHMGMCLLGYLGTKYVPSGHGVMLGLINSVIHTIMYSYYLVALTKPSWVRQWWKKIITQMQIVQFLMLIIHFGRVFFEPNCEYPNWISLSFLPHNILMLILFLDFYFKSYVKKKPVKTNKDN